MRKHCCSPGGRGRVLLNILSTWEGHTETSEMLWRGVVNDQSDGFQHVILKGKFKGQPGVIDRRAFMSSAPPRCEQHRVGFVCPGVSGESVYQDRFMTVQSSRPVG